MIEGVVLNSNPPLSVNPVVVFPSHTTLSRPILLGTTLIAPLAGPLFLNKKL